MQYTTLITLGLIGLATAAPSRAPLNERLKARDEFVACSTMGDNCATSGNRFCDDTGRYSICHNFGDDCWIQHTAQICQVSKRTPTPQEHIDDLLRRDKMNKCSSFPDGQCSRDNNEFCDKETGKKSICHQVPFSSECWIKYTQESCDTIAPPQTNEPQNNDNHDHDWNNHGNLNHDGLRGDRLEKCARFDACKDGGSNFCLDGRMTTCEHVPFSDGEECYLRVSRDTC